MNSARLYDYGSDETGGYNSMGNEWEEAPGNINMKRTLATIRCVPRYGYDHTQVRTIDLELVDHHDDDELLEVARAWFDARNILEAVYDTDVDDDGFFIIINDEAFHEAWGEHLL